MVVQMAAKRKSKYNLKKIASFIEIEFKGEILWPTLILGITNII